MTQRELLSIVSDLERKLNRIVVHKCSSMPTTNVGKIIIHNSQIFFWNGVEYERILTEDDLSYLVTNEILQNAINSVGVGTNINLANTYSDLPAANLNSGVFYWVRNDQGTWWLPGSLGGNYYKKGLYFSNGTTWETAPVPYQATQLEVNAGTDQYKFVTPHTLKNRLANLQASEIPVINYLHEQGLPSAFWSINHNLGKFPSIHVFDTAGTEIEGSVEYIDINNLTVSFNNAFSGKATLN